MSHNCGGLWQVMVAMCVWQVVVKVAMFGGVVSWVAKGHKPPCDHCSRSHDWAWWLALVTGGGWVGMRGMGMGMQQAGRLEQQVSG